MQFGFKLTRSFEPLLVLQGSAAAARRARCRPLVGCTPGGPSTARLDQTALILAQHLTGILLSLVSNTSGEHGAKRQEHQHLSHGALHSMAERLQGTSRRDQACPWRSAQACGAHLFQQ